MLGRTAIIEFLEQHNARNIFYLPGIHTLSLSEGLKGGNINVFVGRHEANLVFMADGFARTSGAVGVVIVTPGPGLGNIVSGCMEAYGNDVPLLIIHIDTNRKDVGKGILHGVVEPENMFKTVTKKALVVSGISDLLPILDHAYHAALTERKGPVLISIPHNLLMKEVPPNFATGEKKPSIRNGMDDLEEALEGKRRPIIIAGKSLMMDGVEPLLDDICRGSSIPFLTTTSGKGIVNEKNPWCFGNVMQKGVVKDILADADIAIAIGTRLRHVDVKRGGTKLNDLIHIDVDTGWMDRNFRTRLKVTGNLMQALAYLRDSAKDMRFDWDIDSLKQKQDYERKVLYEKSDGYKLATLIRGVIPKDTITVWDPNLISYWAEYYFPVFCQKTFIMPSGISSIFYGLPAAIGAKIGRPDRPCLSVCGDGGVLPSMSELSTIAQHHVPVVILVYNNNSFGVLEDTMKVAYSVEGTMSLQNPDFVKVARAFGIKAKRAATLKSLKNTFIHEVTWTEPYLIEFEYPIFPPPWRV